MSSRLGVSGITFVLILEVFYKTSVPIQRWMRPSVLALSLFTVPLASELFVNNEKIRNIVDMAKSIELYHHVIASSPLHATTTITSNVKH